MVIKAVLVDMDGTLADSIPVLYQTYCTFMEQLGQKGKEEEFRDLIGPSLAEVVVILQKKYEFKESLEQLTEQYMGTLNELYRREIQLFPKALECLIYLKQKGILLALVTSADEILAKTFLDAQNLNALFDQVITPKGLVASKPDPAIYKRALEALNVGPEEAVALEDSPNGLAAALTAGISAIRLNHTDEARSWAGVMKQFQEQE